MDASSVIPDRWRPGLSGIVHRLVIGDYAGLASDGILDFTSDPLDTSIGRWIEEYPATLVELPDEAWLTSECGPAAGEENLWWVIVDLWTAEEGRSDLCMEATVYDDGAGIVIKLHDVSVM